MVEKDDNKLVHDRECIHCKNLFREDYKCEGHPQHIKEGSCLCFIPREVKK